MLFICKNIEILLSNTKGNSKPNINYYKTGYYNLLIKMLLSFNCLT